MQIQVVSKGIDVSEALREEILGRVEEGVTKYFSREGEAHVAISREGGGFRVDCSLHLPSGILLNAQGEAEDAYKAAEMAIQRLEKRLRRYKRKLKDHHTHNGSGREAVDVASYVLASTEDEEELPADFSPLVIAETSAKIRTLTVGMAVMELDLTEAPVVLFKNAANGGVNVVYRRADGNVGWIDPALLAEKTAN